MTGLDIGRHVIVEIATLITDDDLEVVAEGPDLVVSRHPSELEAMDDFVRTMHTKSGLLADIEASTVSLEEAGDATLAFIRTHVPKARTVPLAGNSIGTDRRFLAAQLPAIEEFLHYRSVDVSTVKELGPRWFPEVMDEAPPKAGGHRAMDDIRESVAELAYYRSRIFHEAAHRVVPPATPGRGRTARPHPAAADRAHPTGHPGEEHPWPRRPSRTLRPPRP